jgi:hypothetical protein
MRVLRLVAFLVFLVLGNQVPLVAVYAWDCCPCTNPCKYGCTCRGTGHCSSCSYRSVDTVPSSTVVQFNPVPGLSTGTNNDVGEPLMEPTTVRKLVGGNLTFKLLDNAADGQEFSCHGSDEKHMGNPLFQLVHSYTEALMKD